MAPVVLVQPKRAWSNHFFSHTSLYLLLFYFFVFLNLISFNCCPFLMCLTFVPLSKKWIRCTSPKLSYAFCQGLGPFNILQTSHRTFWISSYFIENFCVIELTFLFLFLFCYWWTASFFGGGKNILHDPTVFPELLYKPFVNTLWLYSTVRTHLLLQLHGTVCPSRTTHTSTHTHTHRHTKNPV